MPQLFSPEHTIAIYNPISGTSKTKPRGKRLVAMLEKRGYRVERTQATGHATALAENAAKSGYEAVIIISGDGSLYESIARLPAHVRLAYYPGGSVNLFALNLNLPHKPVEWLELLDRGTTRIVRFGLCNERPFASVASVGFDAQVVAETSSKLKRVIHQGAFAYQFVASLLTYKGAKYEVSIDGKLLPEDVLGVIVGRGQYYGGPNKILPPCDLSSSLLSYIILSGKSKWLSGKFAVGMLTETMSKMNGVVLGSASEIVVQTDPQSYVQLDGDLYGKTPVTFNVEKTERSVLAENVK